MSDFTPAFDAAIDHLMTYEVGGFWELTPDVGLGLISTPAQRKAVGYVNDASDRGGETKFGIAASAHPELNIADLKWDGAERVYFKQYWLAGSCDQLPSRVAALHFDGCANSGIGRASKWLQSSVGAKADGDIGPATLALISSMDDLVVCNAICDLREAFYRAIVEHDGSQAKFLTGWLHRISDMRAFCTNFSVS